MVTMDTGMAIHFRYGRHFPHGVRVLSTIEPMIGSFSASYIRANSMSNATESAP